MNQVQSETPTDLFSAKWSVCSQSTIPNFSAVGFFFGRKLFQDLNVPIGLINASWGDTTGEVWADRSLVLASNDPEVIIGATRNDNTPRVTPTTAYKIGSAYNAMIYPLRNIPVAGAIWYQGESNQGYPYYYPALLNILVTGYRQLWNKTDDKFPFYLAQICPLIGYTISRLSTPIQQCGICKLKQAN
jgi:sialate O-acetylesterase